jgi:hypothetical protein
MKNAKNPRSPLSKTAVENYDKCQKNSTAQTKPKFVGLKMPFRRHYSQQPAVIEIAVTPSCVCRFCYFIKKIDAKNKEYQVKIKNTLITFTNYASLQRYLYNYCQTFRQTKLEV